MGPVKGIEAGSPKERGGSTDEGSPDATLGSPRGSRRFGAGRRSFASGLLVATEPQYSSPVHHHGPNGLESDLFGTEVR